MNKSKAYQLIALYMNWRPKAVHTTGRWFVTTLDGEWFPKSFHTKREAEFAATENARILKDSAMEIIRNG